jgi:hypothetical protein
VIRLTAAALPLYRAAELIEAVSPEVLKADESKAVVFGEQWARILALCARAIFDEAQRQRELRAGLGVDPDL